VGGELHLPLPFTQETTREYEGSGREEEKLNQRDRPGRAAEQ
jgi:hypothetical protein